MKRAWLFFACGGGLLALTWCSSPTPTPIGDIPSKPDATATTSQTLETFAINEIFLGEASLVDGTPSQTAWKDYGYDLDGLVTTKDSSDVCTLIAGAPKTNQVDGNGGIDNAWGSNMLPIFMSAGSLPQPSQTTTHAIQAGAYTLQIQVDGLVPGSGPATGLTVRAFRSGRFGSAPSFDMTTDWPVLASSLANPSDLTTAAWQTMDAYVASDGTVVASVPTDALLSVQLQFIDGLVLPIRHATITFKRSASDPTHLQDGIIAGVMPTEDVVASLRNLATLISPSFCGAAFDGIAQQMEQASDILRDGTNVSGVPCDAISIGIHFNAVQIANPTQIVQQESSGGNLCDGGVVDASASCTPANVSSYTPAPLTPPRTPAMQCGSTALADFFNACLSSSSTQSTCNAFQTTNVMCSQCLLSARSDSTWGPIVTTNTTWDFNVAGCVALVAGDGGASCANAIAAAQGCEEAACANCQFIGGDTPLPREQCFQEADVGGCSSYLNAECDLSEAGAPACRVSDGSLSSFVAFAGVFCSP